MNVLLIQVDDIALAQLHAALKKTVIPINVIGRTTSITDSLNWWAENAEPELIIISEKLSDGSYIQLLELLKPGGAVVVNTQNTVNNESPNYPYRINMAELHRIEEVILDACDENAEAIDFTELLIAHKDKESKKLFISKDGYHQKIIAADEIAYIYIRQKITIINTFMNSKLSIDYSLNTLEELLDDFLFCRVNRQCIVNRKAIKSVIHYTHNRKRLELKKPMGARIVVSLGKMDTFMNWYPTNDLSSKTSLA